MAHMLANDDVKLFANEAWHRKGRVLGRLITIDEMTTALEWVRVSATEVKARIGIDHDGKPMLLDAPNKKAIVRIPNPPPADLDVGTEGFYPQARVLGIHSKRYGIIQHAVLAEAAAELWQQLPDEVEGGASVVTIDHGARAAVSLQLRRRIELPGYTTLERHFNLANSHDGSCTLRATSSLRAVVCDNTFRVNVLNQPSVFSIRHTAHAKQLARQAVRGLAAAIEDSKGLETELDQWLNTTVSIGTMERLISDVIGSRPDPDERRAATMWMKTRAAILGRFYAPDLAPVRNTAWAALMAFQAYEQHLKPTRGETDRAGRHMHQLHFTTLPMTEKAAKVIRQRVLS